MINDTDQPGARFGRRPLLRRAAALGLGFLAMAAVLAACGNPGGGASTAPSGGSGTSGGGSSGGVTVKVGNSSLGKILTDGKGMTLYIYTADSKGHSACTSATCLQLWPPLYTTGTPKAGPGVTGKLGTITRPDNHKKQVTYNGMPLYYYITDKKPGDVTGQNVKDSLGIWYVVKVKP